MDIHFTIPDFWLGVIATVLLEFGVMVVLAIRNLRRDRVGKK